MARPDVVWGEETVFIEVLCCSQPIGQNAACWILPGTYALSGCTSLSIPYVPAILQAGKVLQNAKILLLMTN